MKTLIIYQTKYGTTKEYVDWLAKELSADIVEKDKYDSGLLENYDIVILASPTYMGRIQIAGFLRKNWKEVKSKHVVLFNVGIVDANDSATKQGYEMISQEIRDSIKFFKVKGRIKYDKLNLLEKLVVKILKQQDIDEVSKDQLEPIVNYVNALS